MRRSPRIVAGCICADRLSAFERASAAARALSGPLASISSVDRAMTSAASRASTASTKARLTRPRPRSGPRYHIGNGAASDQMREGIERRFASGEFEETASTAPPRARLCPTNHRSIAPGPARRGRRPAADIEDAVGSGGLHLQLDGSIQKADAPSIASRSICRSLALEALLFARQVSPRTRRRSRPSSRTQDGRSASIDPSASTSNGRAGATSRSSDQRSTPTIPDRVGVAHPPGGNHQQCRRDRQPKARDPKYDQDEPPSSPIQFPAPARYPADRANSTHLIAKDFG